MEYGSARLLLKTEVQAYATGDRKPGGGLCLEAPDWLKGDRPELAGCEYGREVRMLVPRDVEVQPVQVCPTTNCCSLGQGYGRSHGHPHHGPTHWTDKQSTLFYAQRALDDMHIDEHRPGEIRRARRRVTAMQHHLRSTPTRGGH